MSARPATAALERALGHALDGDRLCPRRALRTRSFRHAWIERAMRHVTTYDRYLRKATRDDVWLLA
jgi:hypothetical protein